MEHGAVDLHAHGQNGMGIVMSWALLVLTLVLNLSDAKDSVIICSAFLTMGYTGYRLIKELREDYGKSREDKNQPS